MIIEFLKKSNILYLAKAFALAFQFYN